MKNTRLIFSLLFIFTIFRISAEDNDAEKVYYYNGIPGCKCFYHCSCFSRDYKTPERPVTPSDILWHTFIEKLQKARSVGPYFRGDLCLIVGYSRYSDCSLLSEYYDGLSKYEKRMREEAEDSIAWYRKHYSSPKEINELNDSVEYIKSCVLEASCHLDRLSAEIIPLYRNILSECKHNDKNNLAKIYNNGFVDFLMGDYESSLNHINSFITYAQKYSHTESLLNSKIYESLGESMLEVGLFDESIAALTNAISKDPKNKQAFFKRAVAYFEIGDFDQALSDYIASNFRERMLNMLTLVSQEFDSALMDGLVEGSKEAAINFVPSLCYSVYGLGESVWSTVQHPIETTTNFCNASYEFMESMVEEIKHLDVEKIGEISDEVMTLCNNFNDFSDSEKGKSIGLCIGKYGVDFLAGGALVKSASAIKKVKEANVICNFETMIASKANQEAIVASRVAQTNQKAEFFKNVKIHVDKQNKHVPGKHNYEEGRSIFIHDKPQELLSNFAGKGKSYKDKIPGSPDYREVVDFGEFIGYYINDKNPSVKLPTNKGTIHYSKKGAHIVPFNPNGN